MALRLISADPAIRRLSCAYSSAVGLHEPSLGLENGAGPDKGCGGVRGLLPVITNGYEQPPYLLTLKRI